MGEVDLRAFGALEQDVKHLSERIGKLDNQMKELETSIENLTTLLNKARGAWWVIAFFIGLPSFLAGAAAALKLLPR